MGYTPTDWKKRIVDTPDKYTLVDLGGGLFTITPSEGAVTQEGTPLTEANLNHLETQYDEAGTDLTAHKTNATPPGVHRWTAGKLLKGAGADADPTEIDVPEGLYREGTVADFQANAATGTATDPANLNDASVASECNMDAVNEYAIVDFGKVVQLTQFRQYGNVNNNGTDTINIQYYNLNTHAWVDWVIDVTSRATADWSNWDSSGGTITTDKIKLMCITVVTAFRIMEIEVKY